MIGYTSLGTNNMDRAAKFYDALLGEFGAKRADGDGPADPVGHRPGHADAVTQWAYDNKPATAGNGVMVALLAKDRAQVDQVYKKAIQLGGKDEGAPGDRGGGFYAGYFRDLDGNKLNAFFMG